MKKSKHSNLLLTLKKVNSNDKNPFQWDTSDLEKEVFSHGK